MPNNIFVCEFMLHNPNQSKIQCPPLILYDSILSAYKRWLSLLIRHELFSFFNNIKIDRCFMGIQLYRSFFLQYIFCISNVYTKKTKRGNQQLFKDTKPVSVEIITVTYLFLREMSRMLLYVKSIV